MDKYSKNVSPQACYLELPERSQQVYKFMSIENFRQSISEKYLYFKRVDSYSDFPLADANDGEQLPADRNSNESAVFESNPDRSWSDSLDAFRHGTYACCLSMSTSKKMWENYGNVCLVFDFDRLQTMLSEKYYPRRKAFKVKNMIYKQIFWLNFGLIKYIDRANFRTNKGLFQNPLIYTYIKDKNKFSDENELRISLTRNVSEPLPPLNSGDLPQEFILFQFDFEKAIREKVLLSIICENEKYITQLKQTLLSLRLGSLRKLLCIRRNTPT